MEAVTLYLDIVNEAIDALLALHEHGKNVCSKFVISDSPYCDNCHYSQYFHLCKKIAILNMIKDVLNDSI